MKIDYEHEGTIEIDMMEFYDDLSDSEKEELSELLEEDGFKTSFFEMIDDLTSCGSDIIMIQKDMTPQRREILKKILEE